MSTYENRGFFYFTSNPLHGRWFDLDPDTTEEVIRAALAKELNNGQEIDELFISDSEGFATYFCSRECFDFAEWEEFLEELETSHLDHEVIMAYLENCGSASISDIEDSYFGEWDSDEAFAEDLMEQTGDLDKLPDNLRYYFDYEKYARDLMISDFFESNGHYFRNC